MLTSSAYTLFREKRYFESSDVFFKLGHLIGFDKVQINLNLIQDVLLSKKRLGYRYNDAIDVYLLFKNNISSDYTSMGISVIVPVYNAEYHVSSCVQSLLSQNFERNKFEVIFIINGKHDKSYSIIKKMIANEDIYAKILYVPVGNVSIARNVGLSYAFKQYTCFLDSDDFFEKNFLKSAFDICEENSVVLTEMKNSENGSIQSSKSSSILQVKCKKINYLDAHRFFYCNACKIFPKCLVVDMKFEESLETGEDTVFWMSFLARNHHNLELKNTYGMPDSAYIRVLFPNSLSRQDESFDFSIVQHIRKIIFLRNMNPDNHIVQTLINQRIDTQIDRFIIPYIEHNQDEFDRVMRYIDSVGEAKTIEYIRKKMNPSQ